MNQFSLFNKQGKDMSARSKLGTLAIVAVYAIVMVYTNTLLSG
jgi:hypothetical protein